MAALRQPLGDRPSRAGAVRRLRRAHRVDDRRRRPAPRALGPGADGQGRSLRHAGRRLPRQHREPAAPVARRGLRVVRLPGLQQGGLPRGRGREAGLREHHESPLPERRAGAGQGTPPAAAVLLRVLLAAEHARARRTGRRAARALPGRVRRPAQRHPPLDRRRRADAPARRRPRDGVGAGLGGHAAQHQLHQPHAAPRGARALAAAPVPERAPAPPRDHLRDQPTLPRRGPHALPGRRGTRRAPLADRRERREGRAHGEPGGGRQSRDQRRGRAAHRTAQEHRDGRLPRARPAALPQRHERRDAAALGGAGQPGARGADLGADRRALAAGLRARAEAAGAGRGRPGLPRGLARRQAGQQAGPRAADRRADRRTRSIRTRCSTSRSSGSTSTSASS